MPKFYRYRNHNPDAVVRVFYNETGQVCLSVTHGEEPLRHFPDGRRFLGREDDYDLIEMTPQELARFRQLASRIREFIDSVMGCQPAQMGSSLGGTTGVYVDTLVLLRLDPVWSEVADRIERESDRLKKLRNAV